MEYVIHRINTIGELHNIPQRFGCEIDIRTSGSNLILHHDLLKKVNGLIIISIIISMVYLF